VRLHRRGAEGRFRRDAGDASHLDALAAVRSPPREARRALGEKALQAGREVGFVGDAHEALELLVEVTVEAVPTRGLADQALRDAVGGGGASRQSFREGEDLRVEALRRVHGGDEPHGESARRVEARIQEDELEGAAQADQAG